MTPTDSPPPYTPRDPMAIPSPERRTSPEPGEEPPRTSLSLRGGYLRALPQDNDSVLSPTAYFEERNFEPDQIPALMILDADIHPGTKRDELPFPLSPEDGEARNVTDQDWDTFVNYLLTELGSDELSGANEKGRRWGNMTQEEFFQAKMKMESIVAEWNEAFFMPRGIHFNAKFSFTAPTEPSSSRPIAEEASQAAVPPELEHSHAEQDKSVEHGEAYWRHPGMMGGPGMHPAAAFWGPRGFGMFGGPRGRGFGPHHPRGHVFARAFAGGPVAARGRQMGPRAMGPGHMGPGPAFMHHRSRRSRSSSTSSSSSSSSSDSSVSSLSASSIAAADANGVKDAIAAWHNDPNRKAHLKGAVHALHNELREKHNMIRRTTSKCSRENRAELKENKRAIKEQLRALRDEIQAIKKEKKSERRAAKKVRKAEKKAAKAQRKAARRGTLGSQADDATLVGDPQDGQERDIISAEDGGFAAEVQDPNAQATSGTATYSAPRLAELSKSDRKFEIKARNYDQQADHWERQASHWQRQIDHYAQFYAQHDVQRQYREEWREAHLASHSEPTSAEQAEKLAQKRAKQLQKSQQSREKYLAKAEVVRQKLAAQRVKAEQMAANFRKQAAEARAKMEYQGTLTAADNRPRGQGGPPWSGLGSYWENVGRKIETWGEQVGRDMEAWGEQFGKDMETWGQKMEGRGEGHPR